MAPVGAWLDLSDHSMPLDERLFKLHLPQLDPNWTMTSV